MELESECTPSELFVRAMDLIDPPPLLWSSNANNNSNCHSQNGGGEKGRGVDTHHSELHESENETEAAVKKVKFEESTCFAPKPVTAADAIRAYDLLIHAASSSSSLSREDLLQVSWDKLQNIADTYRALIVTSNLLLELLPETSSTAPSSQKAHAMIGETCLQQNYEENNRRKSFTRTPSLSPTIEESILSTARRCILLLLSMERICAAKRISENIGRSASTKSSFPERGDDIHDYDRDDGDLISNYDWHDDGHLPLPFCHSSVLYECCYLPIKQDPPCSRFERNAWTRQWFRSDRIVSLKVEDYICNNQFDPENQLECEGDSLKVCTDVCQLNVDNDDRNIASSNNITFSTENRKKRRRSNRQPANVEDRNSLVKEGFLLLSCESSGAAPFFDEDERTLSNGKNFVRVYCKLHPSGWMSIEDRSIRRIACDSSQLAHRLKCMKYIIYSKTTCRPCIPYGKKSFHFQLAKARYLGSSMLLNRDQRKPNTDADADLCQLLFAVDDDAGCSFVDGFEWVNALSGVAVNASSIQDQIFLEWNGKTVET